MRRGNTRADGNIVAEREGMGQEVIFTFRLRRSWRFRGKPDERPSCRPRCRPCGGWRCTEVPEMRKADGRMGREG